MWGLLCFPVKGDSSFLPFPFLSQVKSYSSFSVTHRFLFLAIPKEIQWVVHFFQEGCHSSAAVAVGSDILFEAQNLNFLSSEA